MRSTVKHCDVELWYNLLLFLNMNYDPAFSQVYSDLIFPVLSGIR